MGIYQKVRMRDQPDGHDSPSSAKPGSGGVCACEMNRVVDFYCQKHAVAVCGVCAYKDHKSCSAGYLPDIAVRYKESPDLQDLTNTLELLENRTTKCLNIATHNFNTVKESSDSAIEDIRKFRAEIDRYLDEMQEEVLILTNKVLKENEDVFLRQISSCKHMKAQIASMREVLQEMREVDNSEEELFMCAKDARFQAGKIKDKLDEYMEQNKPVFCRFKREQRIEEALFSFRSFGVLQIFRQPQTAKHGLGSKSKESNTDSQKTHSVSKLLDIDVKMAGNKDCKITGSAVLTPQTLLLVDKTNKCVKHVDTSIYTIVAWQRFTSYPCDITSLDQDCAAVTFPDNQQIKILSACRGLAQERCFNVSGECQGIASISDSIIVSYGNPPKVEVMNHYGIVQHTIRAEDKGKTRFQCPIYVTTATDERVGDVFFVSDSQTNTVLKFSMDGRVLMKYVGPSESSGLATLADGSFLVCYRYRQEVMKVSPEGRVTKLIDKSMGIQYPKTISYCPIQNLIYVSNYRPFENDESDNVVSVFRLS